MSAFGLVGALVVPLMGTGAYGATDRSWGPVVNLSRPASYIHGPQVAVDPVGNAAAVWVPDSGERSFVHLATRAPQAAWADPVRVPGTRGPVKWCWPSPVTARACWSGRADAG